MLTCPFPISYRFNLFFGITLYNSTLFFVELFATLLYCLEFIFNHLICILSSNSTAKFHSTDNFNSSSKVFEGLPQSNSTLHTSVEFLFLLSFDDTITGRICNTSQHKSCIDLIIIQERIDRLDRQFQRQSYQHKDEQAPARQE